MHTFSANDTLTQLTAQFDIFACMHGLGANNQSDSWPVNASCALDKLGVTYPIPSDGEFDALKDPCYAAIVVVFYALVILLGVIGNTLVVLTVGRTRQMWNATNIYIANLALADIFVCLLDMPISAYYQLTDDWVFGAVLCRLMPLSFAIVVYTSSLSLAMIAIDRYILIVHPLRRRMSVHVALICIVVIGVFSVSVSMPIAVFSQYIAIDDDMLNLHRRYCIERWPDPHLRRLYGVITLALQFVLPLMLIAALYFRIFLRMSERIRHVSRRKTRTTKMLVAVVAVFFTAWTPFHLYSLISEFGSQLVRGRHYKFVDAILRGVAMSSSCINPVLYGWLNENYRIAFVGILRRKWSQRQRLHRDDSSTKMRTVVVAEGRKSFCQYETIKLNPIE